MSVSTVAVWHCPVSIAQFRLFTVSLCDCEFARHYQSERQENNFHSDDMTDDFMNGGGLAEGKNFMPTGKIILIRIMVEKWRVLRTAGEVSA